MNWIDIVIIVLLVVPTLIGLKMGLVKSILPLGGIMLGVILAGHYYDPLSESIFSWLESSSQSKLLAFIIIFVGVMISTAILASLLDKLLSLFLLGWVNHLGGAFFGLAIGSIVSATLLAGVTLFPFSAINETVHDSRFTAFFLDNFPFVLGFLPEEFDSIQQLFS